MFLVLCGGLHGAAAGAPQADVTNYTYPATVSYFFLLANDGGISSKLSTASGYLKGRDPACAPLFDTRACVDLVQLGGSTPSTAYPIDITNSTEFLQAQNAPENIKVVGSITYCGDPGQHGTGPFVGCTLKGTRNIIFDVDGNAGDLAHEFGHAQNNEDNWGCYLYVMYPQTGHASNVLIADEANKFITPRDTYWNGIPCQVALPDVFHSYFVPQAGSTVSALEGTNAMTYFRACPNNDGGASLPNGARIKVVCRDINDDPIEGIPAADIAIMFNGGTPAQGFGGLGADSIIANSLWNNNPLCPDVRVLNPESATDGSGETLIYFAGADGIPYRQWKWGHYDSRMPVYAAGVEIAGRFTSGALPATYELRIKNFDLTGGTTPAFNQGEAVSLADYNAVALGQGQNNVVSCWRDLNWNGAVDLGDLNILLPHLEHDCDTPYNP